jgi:hypothetical protein
VTKKDKMLKCVAEMAKKNGVFGVYGDKRDK